MNIRKLIFAIIFISSSIHLSKGMNMDPQEMQKQALEMIKLVDEEIIKFENDIKESLMKEGLTLPKHPHFTEIQKKFFYKIKPSELIAIIEKYIGLENLGEVMTKSNRLKLQKIMQNPIEIFAISAELGLALLRSKEFTEFYIRMKTQSIISKL